MNAVRVPNHGAIGVVSTKGGGVVKSVGMGVVKGTVIGVVKSIVIGVVLMMPGCGGTNIGTPIVHFA